MDRILSLLIAPLLAGMLLLTPAQANQTTTLGQFLKLTASEQTMYLAGVVDVLVDTGWSCKEQHVLAEFLLALQIMGQQKETAGTNLLAAIGRVLGEHGCTPEPATTAKSSKDLS